MIDTRHHPRRTVPVMILDAIFAFAAALHTGQLPGRRRARDQEQETDPTGDRRRPGGRWMIAAAVAVVAGTTALVVAFLNAPDGLAPLGTGSAPPAAIEQPVGATRSSPAPGAGGFGSPPPAAPSAKPSATAGAPTTESGKSQPLGARYATAENGQGLLGYRATVTIANPRTAPVEGWQLVITLPRPTLTVTAVSGASAKKDGSVWTFTPNGDTARIAAGGSAQVSFQVTGAPLISAQPTACTINTTPCTGLPAPPR